MSSELAMLSIRVNNWLYITKQNFYIVKQKYASKKEMIDGTLLAFFLALSTYILLKLASYFSEKWIILISVFTFLIGFRMPKSSLKILVVVFSISLIYQNFVVGILTFFALLYLSSFYESSEKLKMSLYLALIPLMFLGMEFLPIIAVSLIFGYRAGLKTSILALGAGIFFTAVLCYPNFGHFSPGFSNQIVSTLKPPQEIITISSLFKLEGFEISRVGLFLNYILNSSYLVVFILCYALLGVIPGYLKDALSGFGDFYKFLAVVVSSNLVVLVFAYLYYPLPGLELNFLNFAEISILSIFAWLLYIFFSPFRRIERTEQEDRVEIQPQTQVETEIREIEGGRLEALRREIEGGGKN